jgi:hypothetical protein
MTEVSARASTWSIGAGFRARALGIRLSPCEPTSRSREAAARPSGRFTGLAAHRRHVPARTRVRPRALHALTIVATRGRARVLVLARTVRIRRISARHTHQVLADRRRRIRTLVARQTPNRPRRRVRLRRHLRLALARRHRHRRRQRRVIRRRRRRRVAHRARRHRRRVRPRVCDRGVRLVRTVAGRRRTSRDSQRDAEPNPHGTSAPAASGPGSVGRGSPSMSTSGSPGCHCATSPNSPSPVFSPPGVRPKFPLL